MNTDTLAKQKDFFRGEKPKVLCLDLEISPMLAYTYEAYEANALRIQKQKQIVAFAASFGREIIVRALPDYEGYSPGIANLDDKQLVAELHEIMEQADFIYGHNIKDFDIKQAKARFIIHDLPVSRKWAVEDTLKMARKYFAFPKNNLDSLTDQFNIGTKTEMKHSDLIWGCIDGDMKKWRLMKKYVENDVRISMGLYKRLAPWHETHTNLNLFWRREYTCPVCLSSKIHSRGYTRLRTMFRRRYQCQDCGHWWRGERIEEEVEKVEQSNI